mmetsp:Transcript_45840/g.103258  ORF Transcript_45840/g.103258 Transcript_45840/m.103258 type:complete len:200 (+) Transcript_45840:279-878(+)
MGSLNETAGDSVAFWHPHDDSCHVGTLLRLRGQLGARLGAHRSALLCLRCLCLVLRQCFRRCSRRLRLLLRGSRSGCHRCFRLSPQQSLLLLFCSPPSLLLLVDRGWCEVDLKIRVNDAHRIFWEHFKHKHLNVVALGLKGHRIPFAESGELASDSSLESALGILEGGELLREWLQLGECALRQLSRAHCELCSVLNPH